MLLLLCTAAFAATPTPAMAIGLAGSGESVLQGGLTDAYPKLAGSFSGEALVSAQLQWPVEVTLELGYRRLSGTTSSGDGSWIWYVPASLLVSGRLDAGAVSVLGGLGPNLVGWEEEGSAAAVPGREDWGVRWGLLLEASVRWHTPWMASPSLDPRHRSGGLDLFVSGGARFSDVADAAADATCHESTCGFDWSAFRLSGGVLLRL
jgi:hypothetical protein